MHLPSFSNTFAMLHLTQETPGTKEKNSESMVMSLAIRLSKYIPISDDRRETMTATLHSAGITMAPETYYARIVVRFVLKLIPALILCIFSPIAAAVFLFWAVWKLFGDLREADKRMTQKIHKIDSELPNFVSDVSEELKTDRNVVRILSGCIPNAGKELKEELEITVADMKSGPQEKALTRLETRVGSLWLNQVAEGLQTVLHGDDGRLYFQILEHDFRNDGIQQLRMRGKKLPDKMRVPAVIIMVCAILTLFAVIIIYLYGKVKAIF